jgi:hypothetical protein
MYMSCTPDSDMGPSNLRVSMFGTTATCLSMVARSAPAGGAAAAAPDGVVAGPSASPHLPVVGAGNPVAVLGLAR